MNEKIDLGSGRSTGLAGDRQAWVAPLVFLTLFMAWMLALRPDVFFHAHLVPDGDRAADDLLIYRAKTFHLLTGNYSRVGFNHPGPFFLQVAALSEVVFFDWLHLFPSYWAAQMFGMSLLHGVALALLLRLWLLITRNLIVSVIAVLAVILAIGLATDINVFVFMWNPDDYVAGATMLAAGLAGLWARGPRWAPLAAIGAVALVHGHASFIGLVPLMLAVFAVVWASSYGLSRSPAAILRAARQSPMAIAATVGVLILGAAPILINVAQHGKGVLTNYLSFAGQSHVNPPMVALRYVWSYIPFSGVWLLIFLIRSPIIRENSRLYSACISVFLCGFASALFYSWKGVDNFSFRYLIFWSSAFFGVGLAAAATRLIELANGKAAQIVVLLAAVAGVWETFRHQPAGTNDPAETGKLMAAASQFRAMAPHGETVALNLDPGSPSWGAAWTNTVGVAALLQRQGSRPFCISHGWHILFTQELKCAPGDRITRTLGVTSSDLAPPDSVVVRMDSAVAYRPDAPLVDVRPSRMDLAGVRLDRDWSSSEGDWVWSSGPTPSLSIENPRVPARGLLTLKGMLFSDGKAPQTVSLLDGQGHILASASALGGDVTLTGPVNATGQGRLDVRLKVANPVSPKSLGLSNDPRRLGFAFKSLTLIPAP